MTKLLAAATFALVSLISLGALAAERTVTLAVQGMYCAACPITVKMSLEAVPGVIAATVSYRTETATVTFDDTKTTVEALIKATTEAGYPSIPRS